MADILATVFLDAEYASLGVSHARAVPRAAGAGQRGARRAKHDGVPPPRRRLEPTGLKAYDGSLTIPLLDVPALNARYGTMVPDVRERLIEAFESEPDRAA
jgi:hypothetical protein